MSDFLDDNPFDSAPSQARGGGFDDFDMGSAPAAPQVHILRVVFSKVFFFFSTQSLARPLFRPIGMHPRNQQG